jgi:hypothetical protein
MKLRRISSAETLITKWAPVAAFAFVGMIGGMLKWARDPDAVLLYVPAAVLAMAGVGVLVSRLWPLADLADTVDDAGEALFVVRGRTREWISLSQVASVGFSLGLRNHQLTLKLATPGRFGDEVKFLLPGYSPFVSYPRALTEDLARRVERARRERAD